MRAIAPPQGLQKRADNVPKPGSGGVHPTLAYCNPTAAAAAPAKAEPSWGRVLATTIKLATSRRLRSPGFGPPATARRQGRNWSRWGRRNLRQLNWHIQFSALDTGQLRAGQVDSRPLATLAALASQYSFRVATFGDTSPSAPVLFREVSLTSAGRGDGTGRLAAALAMVRAQALPYLPAHATIGHLADGQVALTIEFAAPSPLGLLTPVREADLQPAPARDRESLVRPAGEGTNQMRGK